jgi:penicillin-binding protein 1C
MRSVSGTSGAAPVWRDIMLALGPGGVPDMPSGIETRQVRGLSGPATREFFLRGTAQTVIAAVPDSARRPKIVNPVAGSVYALDPDIPPERQRLVVGVTGPVVAHRLVLDKRDLGPADGAPQLLAGPGAHVLRLTDAGGRTVDQIRFTVR